jgi:hypothetical protein
MHRAYIHVCNISPSYIHDYYAYAVLMVTRENCIAVCVIKQSALTLCSELHLICVSRDDDITYILASTSQWHNSNQIDMTSTSFDLLTFNKEHTT